MAEHPVVVKTYRGSQDGAARAFKRDAATMGLKGYVPTSQSYAPGSYGCGSFILALILCFAIIGILILIYMLIVKPDGVLSVTYEQRKSQTATGAQGSKICPRCAEQIKAAAQVCRFCNHQFDPQDVVRAVAIDSALTRYEERNARIHDDEETLAHRLGRWVGQQRAQKHPRK
ncbi:zinc ribbon domain-containing protein [Stenotrophobium rhamnosiphilum]|uniref:Uncharacterized protein n=1 Tax=Stenotrophobium rhamnosiphilum TaxID=2029166 RepID=A0A2T5MEH5_9GAMM|nr:zinc ribbon domain-containing protein [Stenotrophobium rhamnosiphilum]PTU30962.1 hypothetical protein CJD38_11690 [Stenotrophobium rhamnosiphilum]